MRIGKVIGTVTCSRLHPSLVGGRFKLVVPLSTDLLSAESRGDEMVVQNATSEPIVIYDEIGAGIGHVVAISEGAEATMPFQPERKPVDAYCGAILDAIRLDPGLG
ncbi:MAG: EutN/CcmL family microcompartment protein [Planctomycetia bacterium]|nr:EutN/CcmL family microcompartment protein [Planctomycetia bacterium]